MRSLLLRAKVKQVYQLTGCTIKTEWRRDSMKDWETVNVYGAVRADEKLMCLLGCSKLKCGVETALPNLSIPTSQACTYVACTMCGLCSVKSHVRLLRSGYS